MTEIRKIAIYVRVSTRDQYPENQLIKLKEYSDRHKYDYTIFEETESTRKTRPIKADLMNRLRCKEFDGVLVLKLDRWARSITELILEVKELYDKGVTFISVRDNIDLSTATGRLQFNILSAFADFERDIIRERTFDGLDRAKAEGKKLGRPMGSRDTKKGGRRKSGYYLRWSKQSPSVNSAVSA